MAASWATHDASALRLLLPTQICHPVHHGAGMPTAQAEEVAVGETFERVGAQRLEQPEPATAGLYQGLLGQPGQERPDGIAGDAAIGAHRSRVREAERPGEDGQTVEEKGLVGGQQAVGSVDAPLAGCGAASRRSAYPLPTGRAHRRCGRRTAGCRRSGPGRRRARWRAGARRDDGTGARCPRGQPRSAAPRGRSRARGRA